MRRNNIKEIILKHYLDNPNSKLRVRELERLLKIPLPSTIKYCKELKKEHLLATITIGKVTFYTANSSSKQYILEKQIHNLRQIHDSQLVEYLQQEFHNPPMKLFGSFSKGEDRENSDIDIYIETPSTKKIDVKRFEKKLNKKIELFIFENSRKIPNKHLANNIINGITLNGQIEVLL